MDLSQVPTFVIFVILLVSGYGFARIYDVLVVFFQNALSSTHEPLSSDDHAEAQQNQDVQFNKLFEELDARHPTIASVNNKVEAAIQYMDRCIGTLRGQPQNVLSDLDRNTTNLNTIKYQLDGVEHLAESANDAIFGSNETGADQSLIHRMSTIEASISTVQAALDAKLTSDTAALFINNALIKHRDKVNESLNRFGAERVDILNQHNRFTALHQHDRKRILNLEEQLRDTKKHTKSDAERMMEEMRKRNEEQIEEVRSKYERDIKELQEQQNRKFDDMMADKAKTDLLVKYLLKNWKQMEVNVQKIEDGEKSMDVEGLQLKLSSFGDRRNKGGQSQNNAAGSLGVTGGIADDANHSIIDNKLQAERGSRDTGDIAGGSNTGKDPASTSPTRNSEPTISFTTAPFGGEVSSDSAANFNSSIRRFGRAERNKKQRSTTRLRHRNRTVTVGDGGLQPPISAHLTATGVLGTRSSGSGSNKTAGAAVVLTDGLQTSGSTASGAGHGRFDFKSPGAQNPSTKFDQKCGTATSIFIFGDDDKKIAGESQSQPSLKNTPSVPNVFVDQRASGDKRAKLLSFHDTSMHAPNFEFDTSRNPDNGQDAAQR